MQHGREMIVRNVVLLSILICLLSTTIFRNAFVWDNEVDLWEDAVEKSPLSSLAHYNLGKSLYRAGFLTAAQASLLRAVELTEQPTKIADVFCCLGEVYAAQGDRERAVLAYLQVLEINESNVMALNNLGLLLLQSGKHAEAEKLFRQAILIDPKGSRAYVNMGQSLVAQGRYVDAMYYFSAARSMGFFKMPQ